MVDEQIEIRLATKDDSSFLCDLMNDLGYKTTYSEMHKRFENIYNHSDYRTFVASIGHKIVGMAGVTQNYGYEQNGKYIRIISFVTSSTVRQKGIGKKLLQTVEDWANEVGASSILLNCGNREERKQAHDFYKNSGYTIKSSGYIKRLK